MNRKFVHQYFDLVKKIIEKLTIEENLEKLFNEDKVGLQTKNGFEMPFLTFALLASACLY
jgi:hypothetical protein